MYFINVAYIIWYKFAAKIFHQNESELGESGKMSEQNFFYGYSVSGIPVTADRNNPMNIPDGGSAGSAVISNNGDRIYVSGSGFAAVRPQSRTDSERRYNQDNIPQNTKGI